MKKIISNELSAEFNYTEINQSFCFYRISTSGKYIKGGASFLDLDGIEFVRSLAFEKGSAFYIMTMSQKVSRSELIKILREYEDGDGLSVIQLKAEELQPYILVQLFLNSLTNPEDEICSYNNISGRLLFYRPEWIDRDKEGVLWGMNCLEIHVGDDMCMHINAHRMNTLRLKARMKFEKRKIYEYPQYEISYYNHTLKRVPEERINDKNNLIQKSIDGEHGKVTFFDFENYEMFSCTKNGVLFDVFKLVKEQFSDYVQMNLKTYMTNENLIYNRKKLEKYKDMVSEQLLSTGVSIIDEVKSSTSEKYLQELCVEIQKIIPGIRCTVGKRLSKQKVNIRYIHDKTFYKEKDPYYEKRKGYTIQHITVENFNYRTNAAVFNILKELAIKKDLRDGYLHLVDWSNFGYQSDWIFGMVINEIYYFMTIHPDGRFNIERMQRTLFNMTEYDAYMDYFKDKQVIGFVKDSYENINLIRNTNMFTLPDFTEIGNILKNISENVVFSGEELSTLLYKTMTGCENIKIQTEIEKVVASLDKDTKYDKIAIMNLFHNGSTKREIVKSVYENTGVMLSAYLRGEETRTKYLSGSIDINYFKISGNKARFCVGEIGPGMKYTIERASVIREVEAVDGKSLIFDQLLPLMGVEFVRYGMLTVIPFPFKYIREYANMTCD